MTVQFVKPKMTEDELDQIMEAAGMLMDVAMNKREEFPSSRKPHIRIAPNKLKKVYEAWMKEVEEEDDSDKENSQPLQINPFEYAQIAPDGTVSNQVRQAEFDPTDADFYGRYPGDPNYQIYDIATETETTEKELFPGNP